MLWLCVIVVWLCFRVFLGSSVICLGEFLYENAAASEEVCDCIIAVIGAFMSNIFFGGDVILFSILER